MLWASNYVGPVVVYGHRVSIQTAVLNPYQREWAKASNVVRAQTSVPEYYYGSWIDFGTHTALPFPPPFP